VLRNGRRRDSEKLSVPRVPLFELASFSQCPPLGDRCRPIQKDAPGDALDFGHSIAPGRASECNLKRYDVSVAAAI
jgi:hypothetical protein